MHPYPNLTPFFYQEKLQLSDENVAEQPPEARVKGFSARQGRPRGAQGASKVDAFVPAPHPVNITIVRQGDGGDHLGPCRTWEGVTESVRESLLHAPLPPVLEGVVTRSIPHTALKLISFDPNAVNIRIVRQGAPRGARCISAVERF